MLSACERDIAPTSGATLPLVAAPEPLYDELFTRAQVRRIEGMILPGAAPRDETNEVSGSARAARLGQFLFFDERLSSNGHIACASCHDPRQEFSVSLPLGQGVQQTHRHPPTLLNVAHQRWFDWDGKSDSLWSQAARPLESPDEHGATRTQLARLIATDPALRSAYEEIFAQPLPEVARASSWPEHARPDSIKAHTRANTAWLALPEQDRQQITRIFTNALKAIAAYEELLVSGETPFDVYARGLRAQQPQALQALSPRAKRGLKIFLDEGKCVTCHSGPLFSDMAFHNLGLGARDWAPRAHEDEGRWLGVPEVKRSEFSATGPWSADADGERAQWTSFLARTPEDHGQFKTPSLRGVARSAPYMHAGHFETLAEVVRFYVNLDEESAVGHREELLKPLDLPPERQLELVEFLESLTAAPLPAALLTPPKAP